MNKRTESRIFQNIEFSVYVDECEQDPKLIGEPFDCEALDVSAHGLKVLCDLKLYEGNSLNITIGVGEPFSYYILKGELRWVKETDEGYEFGIKVIVDDQTDSARWIKEFDGMFKEESEETAEDDDLEAFLKEIEG